MTLVMTLVMMRFISIGIVMAAEFSCKPVVNAISPRTAYKQRKAKNGVCKCEFALARKGVVADVKHRLDHRRKNRQNHANKRGAREKSNKKKCSADKLGEHKKARNELRERDAEGRQVIGKWVETTEKFIRTMINHYQPDPHSY